MLGVLVCLTGFDVDAVGFLARVSGVQRGLVLGEPGGHGGNAEEVTVTGEELWALEDIVQFGIHQGCNMVVKGRGDAEVTMSGVWSVRYKASISFRF